MSVAFIVSLTKQYVDRPTFCIYVAVTLGPGGMNFTQRSKWIS